jgi:hypothetical protein
VSNSNQPEKDAIKLSFEFDKNVIENVMEKGGYPFPSNPIYEISILKAGTTSYYLKEKLYCHPIKPDDLEFIYLEMDNAQGIISTREDGKMGFQKYPQQNHKKYFKSTEPVLRQISEPDRFYPLFTLKTERLSDQTNLSTNFIASYQIDNDLMISLYDLIKEYRKKYILNQYINEFDPDILEFEIIKNLPKVFLASRQQFEDIADTGMA